METIFERLRPTGKTRRKMIILGAGGIGANLIRYAGKEINSSAYKQIDLMDFDTIELSNLNRTALFGIHDVGASKVQTLKAVNRILQLLGTPLSVFERRVNAETELFNESELTPLIVDCRDTIDPAQLPQNVWVKASYDGGTHVSWHFLPNVTNSSIWRISSDGTYDVTPSFYVPAAMSGVLLRMLTIFTQFTRLNPESHSRVISMDIDEVVLGVMDEVEDGGAR